MEQRAPEEEHLIQYLLGELPENEHVAVEQRFLADNSFHEQLQALEDELMYDYLRGHLPPAERRRFEERYLMTATGHEAADTAGALLEALAAPAGPAASLFSFRWPVFAAALAAAWLVIGSAWLAYDDASLRGRLRSLRDQRPPEAAAALEPIRVSLLLHPGRERSSGQPALLTLQPGAASARVELFLKPGRKYERYQASLETVEGQEIWKQDRLSAGGNPSLKVDLPAGVLLPGDYQIVLRGWTAAGALAEAGDYAFTVTR
jgi:hypothetical protein